MTFDTLYSLNSNGSVQQWTISVKGNTITKEYGQVGGKIQTTSDVIEKGKNIGRANATTPQEQAVKEAQAQWEKKLKSGYVKTLGKAQKSEVDTKFVTGGIEPMLAQTFSKQGYKIKYPAYSQPKLDGIRCIAMVDNGVCTLWSRTRKPINSMPHIVAAIEKRITSPNLIIFDGELYNHDYKDKFEEIVSFVRSESPKEGHEVVQYHIYDLVDTNLPFEQRLLVINSINFKTDRIVKVDTRIVNDPQELMLCFEEDRSNGYEGSIARNSQAIYENKRSYHLQKLKEFDDAEFRIVGVKPGRGRMAQCAVFECVTKDDNSFDCKKEGSLDKLKEYLDNPKKVLGKMLTVRFQGYTNGSVPRFPVGVSIRDYE